MHIKYVIICLLSMAVISCKKNEISKTPPNINIEMFGSWGNDSGCSATFIQSGNSIVLKIFNNNHGHTFNNLILNSKKESIMTKFNTLGNEFSGSFLEGMIVINNYCTEPLHKIDN